MREGKFKELDEGKVEMGGMNRQPQGPKSGRRYQAIPYWWVWSPDYGVP